MKKVSQFSLNRFNNAYHVNFHSNVMAIIEQFGEDSIGLSTSAFNRYKSDIAAETDTVKRSQASPETPKIREADEKRDQFFRYVRNVLANLQFAPDAETRALYDDAKAKILNLYPSTLVNESINEESAHLRGFIMDVRNTFKTKLEVLGISAALNALEKANNDLQELYVTRAQNIAANGSDLTTRCRAAVDDDYQGIITMVEYSAMVMGQLSDESSQMIAKTCNTFIETLNQLITRTWTSIKMGNAGTDPGEEQKQEGAPEADQTEGQQD